jgi:hypothetical protein
MLLDNPRKVRRSRGTPSLLTGNLAYWALGEASGNRVDANPGAHDFAPVNAPANMAGKVGNAANFVQGSTQGLENASVTGILPTVTGWWVGCWAYINSAQSGNPMIFNVSPTSGATTLNRTLWLFWSVALTKFRTGAYASDGTTVAVLDSTLTGLANNTWHRLDWWHDPAAQQLKFRVNGTTDTLAWSNNTLFAGTSQGVGLGKQIGSTSQFLLTGGVDEVGIWNRPPTTTELAAVLAGNTYPF